MTNTISPGTSPAKPLAVRERVGYAFGDFASCLIWQSISLYFLFYCTNVAGIETAAAVSIVSISKILDGVSDIFMGFLIDRTKSRFGKVRPYLLTMALPLALSAIFLFSAPGAFSVHAKFIWMFVWYNMVTTIFYTAFNVPYSSMHLFLTEDSSERQSLSILRLIFAFGSQVLVNASMLYLVRLFGAGDVESQAGWTRAMIVIGSAAFILGLVTFANTKERVTGNAKDRSVSIRDSLVSIVKNKYLLILLGASLLSYVLNGLVSGSSVYYAQYILKNVNATGLITNASTAAQVLSLIFISPFLVKKLPKHVIYQMGTVILTLAFLSILIKPTSLPLILAVNAVKGLAFGMTGPLVYGMCADAIDYGEWKTGISSAGLGAAMLQCMGKFGIALGTAVLGWILSAGGFDASQTVQSASGSASIVAVYTYVPAIFQSVVFLVMFAYTLDKIYPKIKEELRARHEASEEEA